MRTGDVQIHDPVKCLRIVVLGMLQDVHTGTVDEHRHTAELLLEDVAHRLDTRLIRDVAVDRQIAPALASSARSSALSG